MRVSFRFMLLLALLALAVTFLLRGRSATDSTPESSVASVAAPAAAPAVAAGPRAPVGTWVYDCGQDFKFTVVEDGPTRVRVILPDTEVILSQVEAASGARYEAAGYVYWSKEEQCRLETPTGIYVGCDSDVEQAIWEDARRRGVDFRASGENPFWELEIRGEVIVMEAGQGGVRHQFPAPAPATSESGEITYRTLQDGHGLVLTIVAEPCDDAPAGAEPAVAKTVAVLDGRIYRGCGRPLR